MVGSAPSRSVPLLLAFRCSIYCCAAADRGNAGRVDGISPPFWRSSSATGKAGSFLLLGTFREFGEPAADVGVLFVPVR